MAGPYGRMCRDLHGGSLHIKGKRVLDVSGNLDVRNAKVRNVEVTQNGVICGDLEVKGNLIVGGEHITGNTQGNCTGNITSSGYITTIPISFYAPPLEGNPRGENFTFGPTNYNYHIFTGVPGNYKVIVLAQITDASFPATNDIVITEMIGTEFSSNPVPNTVVDIGNVDSYVFPVPIGSLAMLQGNVTATQTPSVWYYWFTGAPGSRLREIRVESVV